MGEQRNRVRVVVRGVRGAPTFADKYLWIKTFPPLLKLVGEAPLSKEVSKGELATRSRATGVALLDGYLIRSVAGGHEVSSDRNVYRGLDPRPLGATLWVLDGGDGRRAATAPQRERWRALVGSSAT